MDIKEVSRFLKTTGDAAEMQHALDQLADSLYRTDTAAEESLRKLLPYEQALALNKLAAQYGVSTDDKAKIQEFFVKVKEAINTLPVVQITLAMRPNASLVNLIHDWFYRTYQKRVLLDIIVNPSIIAGSIISANGKYYDYSLGKQTTQLIGGTQ